MDKTVKQRRVKVADKYSANGYGRGVNSRPVYMIDGKYYAYHPQYAKQDFSPLTGEFAGYIACNKILGSFGCSYYAISSIEAHREY